MKVNVKFRFCFYIYVFKIYLKWEDSGGQKKGVMVEDRKIYSRRQRHIFGTILAFKILVYLYVTDNETIGELATSGACFNDNISHDLLQTKIIGYPISDIIFNRIIFNNPITIHFPVQLGVRRGGHPCHPIW